MQSGEILSTTTMVELLAKQLRRTVDPESLGFADTSELVDKPMPWIGQDRAKQAAQFGMGMTEPDYNLFVLGEVGSGRTTLLGQLMHAHAEKCAVPPDLCYLHNFEEPERPRALRLKAGQGRVLRQMMLQLAKRLQAEVPKRLEGQDFKTRSEQLEKAHAAQEATAFSELAAFGDARSDLELRRGVPTSARRVETRILVKTANGVYGASYGGYATLMAMIKRPELFKWGINYVGVTDMEVHQDTQPAQKYGKFGPLAKILNAASGERRRLIFTNRDERHDLPHASGRRPQGQDGAGAR